MSTVVKQNEFITFSPDLRASDGCANYWMRQVTIRLRREISWCWHERGVKSPGDSSTLPPFSDRASATLDLSRFWAEKQDFFNTDVTARYLTEQLSDVPPDIFTTVQGSFGWVVGRLELDEVAAFALALALTVAFDSSMGSVIAACLNDPAKIHPNLTLTQKLWDHPDQVLRLADPFHPLFRYGLIKYSRQNSHYYSETRWDAPLTVPSLVAGQLLFPETSFPQGLNPLVGGDSGLPNESSESARIAALRLTAATTEKLRLVPLIGAKGSGRREVVEGIARANGKQALELIPDTLVLDDSQYLNSIATVCWLRDTYLFLNRDIPKVASGDKPHERVPLPAQTIPATVFLALSESSQLSQLPSNILLPAVRVPPASYAERVGFWQAELGAKAAGLDQEIAECARRFRFEKETVHSVCEELQELPAALTGQDLTAACRAELDSDIGELASQVTPRFSGEQLVLPPKQQALFAEILKAMKSLTEVHYGWGTAKVWNEGGISVLFAGPPGTGKTMGAEILALKLDLPMYRIDLSQVVNKYIGETEKNLKRLFDAADVSDMILFFDEADSLFGRRTEVSDAHDRYANLEISYLLERMERFKGLAILATNRKKDLDEAFLRRLRYIVDFPLPDAPERKRIWQQVIPTHADSSAVEFDFLAEQFPLAGGNIRSIVFNACLQCANGSSFGERAAPGRLTMQAIITAVKREYDKVNRTLSLEQYGAYSSMVEELERE